MTFRRVKAIFVILKWNSIKFIGIKWIFEWKMHKKSPISVFIFVAVRCMRCAARVFWIWYNSIRQTHVSMSTDGGEILRLCHIACIDKLNECQTSRDGYRNEPLIHNEAMFHLNVFLLAKQIPMRMPNVNNSISIEIVVFLSLPLPPTRRAASFDGKRRNEWYEFVSSKHVRNYRFKCKRKF